MEISEAPRFIVEKRKLKPRKLAVKVAAKLTKKRKKYDESKGDLGTPEFRARMLEADLAAMTEAEQKQYFSGHRGTLKAGVTLEARERSSTGHVEKQGARIETQLPHDRYKVRGQLDPDNSWRNLMLWESAERLRRDFEQAGLASKTCSSFEPRVTGGKREWEGDKQVAALVRYKKAMNKLGISMRSPIYYICIAGEFADSWARRNGMVPQAGLAILRLALGELADFYGLAKNPVDDNVTLKV
jgi:hypothetical protein